MGELFEAAATLRFFGDDLEPDHVSALLGARPTSSFRKGDVLAPGRDGRERRAHTGSWRLQAGRRSPGHLDALVHELLNGLSDDLDVWADLTRRFRSDIFFGLFMTTGNEGVSLSPHTLLAGGRRGVPTEISAAFCGSFHEEDAAGKEALIFVGARGLAFDFDICGDGLHAG